MTAPAVIDTRAVGRTYEAVSGPVHALDQVSFGVRAGELVAVVGPSGSGKSTLLNILGLLDRPSAGTYLLDGVDTADLREKERTRLRAQRIGFVFQAFHLVAHKPAGVNVVLPLVYNRAPRHDRRRVAEQALARVGMGHRVDALPHTLSGGEKQRVAIARATVHRPSLLLCDEPTGNLDTESTGMVMGHLAQLAADGLAVVVVTHDPTVADRADRVLRVRDGRVDAAGEA
ncbi:ABC transporter ATP-binding protein [Streptomyces sp. NPDC005865]|uniref:ABC transporter ATP-binding protein n=1 Tax=Streptomyces sp. NPDC005865 TaxID=3155453 RepID=UPI00340EB4C5